MGETFCGVQPEGLSMPPTLRYGYVYRCMRGGRADLEEDPDSPLQEEAFGTQPDAPLNLRRHVAMALNEGSDFRSPFLHCSRSPDVARKWMLRGRERRHDHYNYLVQIDISGLQPGRIIDVSDRRSQRAFIGPFASDGVVQDHLSSGMRKALADQEVLLVERGTIPRSVMTVVDDSFTPLRPLDDMEQQLGMRPRFPLVHPKSRGPMRGAVPKGQALGQPQRAALSRVASSRAAPYDVAVALRGPFAVQEPRQHHVLQQLQ